MAVTVQCPNPACRKSASLPDSYLGRTVRCKHCGTKVTLSRETLRADSAAETQAGASQAASLSPAGDLPQQIGRFQIRACLGQGAFGAVYRAHDPQLERDVALKVPHASALTGPKAVERFLREAKSAARLLHAHIVPIYEAGQDGGRYYIASAFIAGRTLAGAIDEKPFDPRSAAQIVHDLAEALQHAHGLGIVHRDVKPANIMLDAQGAAHLMDFGLAHRADAASKLTQEGAIMGTPGYMAPEQAEGKAGDPLPASDQYSLGVVLYELLCGQPPFCGPVPVVLYNVLHTEPATPRSLRPEIPRELESICLKTLAKQPSARYASCRDLADDLRRWLDGKRVRSEPGGNPKAAPSPGTLVKPSAGSTLAQAGGLTTVWARLPRPGLVCVLVAAGLVAAASLVLIIGLIVWQIRQHDESLVRTKQEEQAAYQEWTRWRDQCAAKEVQVARRASNVRSLLAGKKEKPNWIELNQFINESLPWADLSDLEPRPLPPVDGRVASVAADQSQLIVDGKDGKTYTCTVDPKAAFVDGQNKALEGKL